MNANSVSATQKYIDAWNDFINAYQGSSFETFPRIITNRSGDVGLDYFGDQQVQRTLYQYLNDKNDLDATNFPDFKFKFYKIETSMGI